jgi:hypothetical protein
MKDFETTLVYVTSYSRYLDYEDYETTIYETRNYCVDIEYDLCPDNDKILLKFSSERNDYSFEIMYFSGQKFETFYTLLYKRFGDQTDLFGKISETFDGKTSTIIKQISVKNVVNSIIYALKEMFICIKQIIETHKEQTANYCLLQTIPENSSNYEEYIHNVACKVIIESNYYIETFPLDLAKVEFIHTPREFCSFFLEN